MRLTPLIAASVLVSALLGGCSGDDESDGGPSSAATSEKPRTAEEVRGDCETSVELTGKAEAAWEGPGFVVTENQSGPVLYRAEKGKYRLTLLAADDQFDATGTLAVGNKQYSLGGDGTLDVDPDGGGAEVDTEADGVRVVASFDC